MKRDFYGTELKCYKNPCSFSKKIVVCCKKAAQSGFYRGESVTELISRPPLRLVLNIEEKQWKRQQISLPEPGFERSLRFRSQILYKSTRFFVNLFYVEYLAGLKVHDCKKLRKKSWTNFLFWGLFSTGLSTNIAYMYDVLWPGECEVSEFVCKHIVSFPGLSKTSFYCQWKIVEIVFEMSV